MICSIVALLSERLAAFWRTQCHDSPQNREASDRAPIKKDCSKGGRQRGDQRQFSCNTMSGSLSEWSRQINISVGEHASLCSLDFILFLFIQLHPIVEQECASPSPQATRSAYISTAF